MHPVWIAGAVILALYLVLRRRAHGRGVLALGALAAVGAGLIGFGVVELPNVEKLIEDAGQALGKWTYLAVGVLAFLETGAFIGLVAPGETTVIVGGLVAGQGEISLMLLIAIVWTCAVLGDVTSYALGRRLGRDFMVRHGGRVKITEERLEQVEAFFERRGGMTILIGRFIGLVRAIAPFIAGASRMPLRKFLPYDVLGAGLWATTFCVLGYVFWRSFDQLTAWVSRGLFAFGLFVALIVGIVFLVRLQRSPELRRADRQVDRRAAREAAAAPGRAVPARGLAARRAAAGTAVAAAGALRLEPLHAGRPGPRGHDAARARRGRLVRVLPARRRARRRARQLHLDDFAFDIADRPLLRAAQGRGGLGHCARLVRGRRRARRVDRALGGRAAPLPRCRRCSWSAFLLTWLAVDVAKEAYDRPRPPAATSRPRAWRSLGPRRLRGRVGRLRRRARARRRRLGRALRARDRRGRARVVVGLTRVYLRAHYLSDVEGGVGLATAIFALLRASSRWSSGTCVRMGGRRHEQRDLDLHRARLGGRASR